MICPKCHNENKYDDLTCDFCMAPLPMSKAREVEINKKKNKMSKSMTKLVGLLMGIFILVAIVVIAFIVRKH